MRQYGGYGRGWSLFGHAASAEKPIRLVDAAGAKVIFISKATADGADRRADIPTMPETYRKAVKQEGGKSMQQLQDNLLKLSNNSLPGRRKADAKDFTPAHGDRSWRAGWV